MTLYLFSQDWYFLFLIPTSTSTHVFDNPASLYFSVWYLVMQFHSLWLYSCWSLSLHSENFPYPSRLAVGSLLWCGGRATKDINHKEAWAQVLSQYSALLDKLYSLLDFKFPHLWILVFFHFLPDFCEAFCNYINHHITAGI